MKSRETIFINDNECAWVKPELWKYKEKFLAFIKELPDGSDEMAYCDEHGNIFPDSPRIISIPGQTDAGCIIYQ